MCIGKEEHISGRRPTSGAAAELTHLAGELSWVTASKGRLRAHAGEEDQGRRRGRDKLRRRWARRRKRRAGRRLDGEITRMEKRPRDDHLV